MKRILLAAFIFVVIGNCYAKDLSKSDISLLKNYADKIESEITNKDIEFIQNDILNRQIIRTGYYCVIDVFGKIIVHPRQDLRGKDLNEIDNQTREYIERLNVGDQYYFYKNPLGTEYVVYLRKIKKDNLIIRITNPIKTFLGTVKLE